MPRVLLAGGVVPWAMLAGYGEAGQWGATAWLSRVQPDDFSLDAYGAAVSIGNRVEFSLGRQRLGINSVAAGEYLQQSILGVKTRLFGDPVYSRMPQTSLGILYKQNDTFDIPQAVGAVDDQGVDFYLAARKLFLDGPFHRSLLVNGTVRATRANQMGLLGFGGDRNDSHELVAEFSAGLFITRHWIVGAEW